MHTTVKYRKVNVEKRGSKDKSVNLKLNLASLKLSAVMLIQSVKLIKNKKLTNPPLETNC